MDAKERYLASMLVECILSGDISSARELLTIGADPNFVLEEGATPIHVAVSIEDESLSEKFTHLLLQFGADPNSRSAEGSTPLHAAAAFGRANNVRLLLEKGGDPDLLDQDGMTVADNIEASNSEMCKIYLILYRQRQAVKCKDSMADCLESDQQHMKRASNQRDFEDEDTLVSAGSLTDCSSQNSSDNSTLNHTAQQIQVIQDNYNPRIHQIDVTSPDHPLLVPRTSDDTIAFCSNQNSSSDASYHTCQSSNTDESSDVCQKHLSKKLAWGCHLACKPVHHNSGAACNSSFELNETIPCSENATFDFCPSTPDSAMIRHQWVLDTSNEDSLDLDPDELSRFSLDSNYSVVRDDTIRSDVIEGLDKLSLLSDIHSDSGEATLGVRTSQQHCNQLAPDAPSADSGLPASWSDVDKYPLTSSRNPSVISLDASQLSRLSQNHSASSVCSCAATKVETSIKSEDGFSLIETHLIPQQCDAVHDVDCTAHSHDLTAASDWLDISASSSNSTSNHSQVVIPREMAALSNSAIRAWLMRLGDNPGPVTDSTTAVYLKRLVLLDKDPELAKRKTSDTVSGFLPEICQVLAGDLDLSTSTVLSLEFEMCKPFIDHDPKHLWREGSKKGCFNYFLLDPRVTQNLPVRAKSIGIREAFECFLRAIFYIGKGVRSRPYAHFKEAIKYMLLDNNMQQAPGPKVAHILDIWQANLGVVSLHVFQNVIPCEAYTREACMIEALGLYRLTNKIAGKHYGPVSAWPIKKRRTLGVLLLQKAFRIFLSEGERQIRPYDVKN